MFITNGVVQHPYIFKKDEGPFTVLPESNSGALYTLAGGVGS